MGEEVFSVTNLFLHKKDENTFSQKYPTKHFSQKYTIKILRDFKHLELNNRVCNVEDHYLRL